MKIKCKSLLLLLLLLIIPCLGALQNLHSNHTDKAINKGEESEVWQLEIHTTGEVVSIPATEYIKGVVAAEMPISFEEEALKAQAVAAHTYALRLYQKNGILSDDPAICQAYQSTEQLQEKYKESFQENWEKISRAVDAVANQILTYEQQPIAAVYHSMSAGMTESSKAVWGGDLPYLQPVDSSFDKLNPNFKTQTPISVNWAKKKLSEAFPGCNLSGDPSGWIKIESYDPSGYVADVSVGGIQTTGTKLRSALGLKSARFSIEMSDANTMIFTTEGNGHGIGMSQYGANAMAQNGASYTEILQHYYPETTLTNLNS